MFGIPGICNISAVRWSSTATRTSSTSPRNSSLPSSLSIAPQTVFSVNMFPTLFS